MFSSRTLKYSDIGKMRQKRIDKTFDSDYTFLMTDEWMTTKQVAELLDVHPATVSAWVARGDFPGAKKLNPLGKNSHYRIPRQSVENFIKAQPIMAENDE